MSRTFIISGTDTGVGKTIFAAALAGALKAHYWKPIQAGLEEESDSETVARLSGLAPAQILPEAYRLKTPCSPHRAAEIDGVLIEGRDLVLPDVDGPLVVEGAGGAMVPLDSYWLQVDQFAVWQKPVIVVARTALGTINHSLLTIDVLQGRDIPIHGLVFMGDPHQDSEIIIPEFSGVRRLGRLPQLNNLTPTALAAAFADNFNLDDFA